VATMATSLVAQTVKHLPTMWETWVQSLGREYLLEKEMATYSSTLAWKIHGWRSLVGCSPWDRKELDTSEMTADIPIYMHIYVYRYTNIYIK